MSDAAVEAQDVPLPAGGIAALLTRVEAGSCSPPTRHAVHTGRRLAASTHVIADIHVDLPWPALWAPASEAEAVLALRGGRPLRPPNTAVDWELAALLAPPHGACWLLWLPPLVEDEAAVAAAAAAAPPLQPDPSVAALLGPIMARRGGVALWTPATAAVLTLLQKSTRRALRGSDRGPPSFVWFERPDVLAARLLKRRQRRGRRDTETGAATGAGPLWRLAMWQGPVWEALQPAVVPAATAAQQAEELAAVLEAPVDVVQAHSDGASLWPLWWVVLEAAQEGAAGAALGWQALATLRAAHAAATRASHARDSMRHLESMHDGAEVDGDTLQLLLDSAAPAGAASDAGSVSGASGTSVVSSSSRQRRRQQRRSRAASAASSAASVDGGSVGTGGEEGEEEEGEEEEGGGSEGWSWRWRGVAGSPSHGDGEEEHDGAREVLLSRAASGAADRATNVRMSGADGGGGEKEDGGEEEDNGDDDDDNDDDDDDDDDDDGGGGEGGKTSARPRRRRLGTEAEEGGSSGGDDSDSFNGEDSGSDSGSELDDGLGAVGRQEVEGGEEGEEEDEDLEDVLEHTWGVDSEDDDGEGPMADREDEGEED